MLIHIIVKTESPVAQIIKKDEENYTVFVKSKPERNQANYEILCLLSRHFDVPQEDVRIVHGLKSKRKLVEIK